MIKVCLLGASGSIGTQTLDVIKKHPNDFELTSFSIGKQTRKISYILRKNPNVKDVYLISEKIAKKYAKLNPNIRFYSGKDGISQLIKSCDCDMVVNALVGFSGLVPTIVSLKQNKILALANKESLVVGGEIVNELLKKGNGKLYPIDSEHSALYKCLMVDNKDVDKLIITASGGAFRKLNREQLKNVTPEDALNHPTWKMGKKITIDCATMVNKAFEIIEAHYLYGYPSEKIDVLLHDESHIHSIVKYNNGFYRGEDSKPDMRNPIRFAMFMSNDVFKTFYVNSLDHFKNYHFHKFDIERYPCVKWAKTVIDNKGTYGAVFNASNEVAVNAFLNHKIAFLDIEYIINKCMSEHKNLAHPDLNTLLLIDKSTREKAELLVNERSK